MRNFRILGIVISLPVLGTILLKIFQGAWSSEPLILFSSVEGLVHLNGRPLSGVEVLQTVQSNRHSNVPAQKTITDANGIFKMSAVTMAPGLSRLSLSQEVTKQKIEFFYMGKTYEGWLFMKTDYEANTESKGQPFQLSCDLSVNADYSDSYFGVCKIESIR